jgi:hypothetical protein
LIVDSEAPSKSRLRNPGLHNIIPICFLDRFGLAEIALEIPD